MNKINKLLVKKQHKSISIIFLFTASLLFFTAATSPKNQPINSNLFLGREKINKPLNILFIVADDLGWSDLACYGADLHESPNIDQLAAKSYKFTNSYSAAPVCSPTRASLLTGKYPARLQMTTWSEGASLRPSNNHKFIQAFSKPSLPLEEITTAEVLRDNGYLTAHVGKWHLGDMAHYPETQGFDVTVGASFWGAPATYFFPYAANVIHKDNSSEYRYIPGLDEDPDGHYFTNRKGEYLTDRLTDEAMKIMADAGDKPFYLNLCYHSVHIPVEGKPELVNYFKKKINNTNKLHHQNEGYAAMVKSVDENVGRLLNKLKELGIEDNTLVIFISDNGGYIGSVKGKKVTDNYPLRSGKGSLYEGGIRIPTLIYWPGVTIKGKEIDVPISTIDFFPTLLEVTNAKYGYIANVDGVSLVPLLKGKNTEFLNRTLFWHFPHYYQTTNPVSAVREGNWKLIEYLEDGHLELYNLDNDIREKNNILDQSPQKGKELLEKLKIWRKKVNAQMPTPNPNYDLPKQEHNNQVE